MFSTEQEEYPPHLILEIDRLNAFDFPRFIGVELFFYQLNVTI
jgi:hypothetical protein